MNQEKEQKWNWCSDQKNPHVSVKITEAWGFSSSAQSVASPSKIEGFREFEADLSALFCKQNAFGAQSVISPSKNERFRGV